MTNWKRMLCFLFAGMLMSIPGPGRAEEKADVQALVERLVMSYAVYGARDREALKALAAADSVLAEKWEKILGRWETPVTVRDALPETLPQDDTL